MKTEATEILVSGIFPLLKRKLLQIADIYLDIFLQNKIKFK